MYSLKKPKTIGPEYVIQQILTLSPSPRRVCLSWRRPRKYIKCDVPWCKNNAYRENRHKTVTDNARRDSKNGGKPRSFPAVYRFLICAHRHRRLALVISDNSHVLPFDRPTVLWHEHTTRSDTTGAIVLSRPIMRSAFLCFLFLIARSRPRFGQYSAYVCKFCKVASILNRFSFSDLTSISIWLLNYMFVFINEKLAHLKGSWQEGKLSFPACLRGATMQCPAL